MKRDLKTSLLSFVLIFLIIDILLVFEYAIQVRSNREGAYRSADIVCGQIIGIIEGNEQKERALVESLKEDYITRARAVSYIIDNNSLLEYDTDQLVRVARLISVDEIHLFDESGTIYAGTVPKYYGYSFDSGEQMTYFKPMLTDRSLSMCQDVTPNTAESKAMMYAICWNDSGTRMIQIGIEPLRLLEELRSSEIDEVVAGMPSYDGMRMMVADHDSQVILGSTMSSLIGCSLQEAGITGRSEKEGEILRFTVERGQDGYYCSTYRSGQYDVIILNDKMVVNQNVPLTLGLTFIYLLLASLLIIVIVRSMTTRILEEKENATTDAMTGYLNRRAYETDIETVLSDADSRLTYASLDLNGLKKVNDTMGHDSGDKLIKAAAKCIRQCFGSHGRLYRIGGDEFAAIIYADDHEIRSILQDFRETTAIWSIENDMELAVSCGVATRAEFPDMTITELAREADQRMYDDKATYYAGLGVDRRHHR